MRGRITALAVGGSLLATAATAHAEPGLTVDPQSPAGVEYAVPLDQGRGHNHGGGSGGGRSTGGGAGSDSSGLFGSGIKPVSNGRGGASAPSGTKPKAGSSRKQSGGRGGAGHTPAVAPAAASAGYSTSGPIAGVIGGILLVGGGFGLIVRRRGRRTARS